MSASVVRQVATRGVVVLVLSLALAGLGTGAALHIQRVRALDQALLAAAHGHAHPEVDSDWEVEHSEAPFDTWVVHRDDPRVPTTAVRDVIDREVAVFIDHRDERMVLLPVEDEDEHRHMVVAAAASRLALVETVGPFAMAYLLFSTLVAGVASVVLVGTVRAAFVPVRRARDEAEHVLGFGQGMRLTEDAPAEIRALLVAINGLLARLDVAWAAQGRFTAEAAHELRTPVTAMLGELEVALRRDHTESEYRAVLQSAHAEVVRLARIVEGLTALARLDAGEAERGRELVRARELALSALDRERSGLEDADCSVSLEIEEDSELEANAPLVELALGNLLRNAARHAPGGPVVLRVRHVGGQAVFEVDDSGPGVADPEAMFDRFARDGRARMRDHTGLGLGLPIAREVARRHNGDCTLHSAPSGGTRARLTVEV